MEGRKYISTALQRAPAPAKSAPNEPEGDQEDRGLNICVVFTSPEPTVAAIKKAGALASSLGAHITLMALQVVPFPLPLDDPPVLLEWNEERFRSIASESPVETMVRLYLCRDKIESLKGALRPMSVVVIGGRKSRWQFTAAKRLAREMRRAGHEVIVAEKE